MKYRIINKIINMTPHDVVIFSYNNEKIRKIESSGVFRLSSNTEVIGKYENIPISRTTFGKVDLPIQKENVIYIVSSIVCMANKQRNDLYIPDQIVRDANGNVIGCKSLSLNPYLMNLNPIRED